MTPAEDQAHLLRALVRNGVKFVVVGGVAAQLRGWAGATTDLDIAAASEDTNGERINRALSEVGLTKADVGGLGTSFQTRHGRLEIVRRVDGVGMYDDWIRNASEIEFEHLTTLVAASGDIINPRKRPTVRRTAPFSQYAPGPRIRRSKGRIDILSRRANDGSGRCGSRNARQRSGRERVGFAERARQGRCEGFKRVRLRKITAGFFSDFLFGKWQQRFDSLADAGPQLRALIAVVVGRFGGLGDP